MTALYIVVKVAALFAIILVPLIGPKKKKAVAVNNPGKIAVNENGYLENFDGDVVKHQQVF